MAFVDAQAERDRQKAIYLRNLEREVIANAARAYCAALQDVRTEGPWKQATLLDVTLHELLLACGYEDVD